MALGVGVLIDVDHLFDYYQWYVPRKTGKIFLLFHAWEYSIVGLLLAGIFYAHPVLLGAFIAHLGHVAADHVHNGISLWGYSITYRALVRFESSRVASRHNVVDAYKPWPGLVPFGNL